MAKFKVNDYFSKEANTQDGSRRYIRCTLFCENEEGKDVKIKFNTQDSANVAGNLEAVIGKIIDLEVENVSGIFKGEKYDYFQEVKGSSGLVDLGLKEKVARNAAFKSINKATDWN